jgi:phosphatidylglycerol lysyltransferase
MRRAEREGAEFSIVPAARVPAIMGELRLVSDEWLHAKGQREKAFSVGRFDEAYIARCDIAVVRKQGAIVAFANL